MNQYNTRDRALQGVLGVLACLGGIWLICTVAGLLLKIAGVS